MSVCINNIYNVSQQMGWCHKLMPLQGWRGDPPNLYDISGSAHFINKADNGIVIHRNRDPDQGDPKIVRCFHEHSLT